MTDIEHQIVNVAEKTKDAPSGNGLQVAGSAVPDAHNHPDTHFLAPLLAAISQQPSEQSSRAKLLRRALTSPWRQFLTSPGPQHASSRAAADRSCHAFGSPAHPAAAIRPDASVPGRVDRRDSTSVASHRSLFTIDGLPESAAVPDPAPLAVSPEDLCAAPAGESSCSGSGRQASCPRVPYRAGQCAGVSLAAPSAPPLTAPLQHRQQQRQHPIHQSYQYRIQIWNPNPSTDPSLQRLGDDGHSSHSVRRSSMRTSDSVAPAVAAPAPLQQRILDHAHLESHRGPHRGPHGAVEDDERRGPNAQSQSQSQPQPPQSLYGSSLGPGPALLGVMHDLLEQPGGTDAFVHSIQEPAPAGSDRPAAACGGGGSGGAQSAEPLLARHPLAGSDGVPAKGAAAAAAAITAAAGPPPPLPSAAGPSFLDWDDVRNPMSFNYDPSMDPKQHQQHQQHQHQQHQQHQHQHQHQHQQQHQQHQHQQHQHQHQHQQGQGCTGNHMGGNLNPDVPDRSAPGAANGLAAAQDSARGGGAVDGTVTARGSGDDGIDGAEVVAANGPMVVLEMKGPRGTPTTHTAAMAAFMSGASASPAAPDAAAAAAGMQLTLRGRMASYFSKWRGVGDTLMPADHPIDIFWSWLGAFLSILVVAVLNQYLTPQVSLPLMIASFGASAVLLFGVPASKLAQPRNFIGGQVVSAIVGVAVRLAFMHVPDLVWLSSALGMSLALAAMQLTRTVHPPGGASALIASSVPYIGPWYGFKFVLTVFFGCLAMLAVAVVVNNLSARRRYPTYWMGK